MDSIPDSVTDWFGALKRAEPVELSEVDKRVLRDMLRRPEMREVWRRVVEVVEGESERLKTLNTLVPEDAAEALRIQGSTRALIVLAETFWESVR